MTKAKVHWRADAKKKIRFLTLKSRQELQEFIRNAKYFFKKKHNNNNNNNNFKNTCGLYS